MEGLRGTRTSKTHATGNCELGEVRTTAASCQREDALICDSLFGHCTQTRVPDERCKAEGVNTGGRQQEACMHDGEARRDREKKESKKKKGTRDVGAAEDKTKVATVHDLELGQLWTAPHGHQVLNRSIGQGVHGCVGAP